MRDCLATKVVTQDVECGLRSSSAGRGPTGNVPQKYVVEREIRDILMKSDKLKTSAKNNTQKDFEFLQTL